MANNTPKAILPSALQLAEYARSVFRVIVPVGTTTDDIVIPSFWAHVARQLKPGFLIEVLAEDHKWFAVLFVRKADGNAAYCTILDEYDLASSPLPVEPHGFIVKHRGPRKWSVVRQLDGAVMIENLDTEAEADEWIEKHTAPVSSLG